MMPRLADIRAEREAREKAAADHALKLKQRWRMVRYGFGLPGLYGVLWGAWRIGYETGALEAMCR